MTYRELLAYIQTLDKDQLDREVLVYNQEEDFFYENGTEFRVTDREIPGMIDKDFPYLTV